MMRSKIILTVDHNARNLELLGDFLQKQGYQARPATTLEQFGAILDGDSDLGLALVDISGFDRHIWEYCERLAEQNIPFIVISPRQAAAIREEGRSHGAHDVLVKPLVVQELTALISSLLAGE